MRDGWIQGMLEVEPTGFAVGLDAGCVNGRASLVQPKDEDH